MRRHWENIWQFETANLRVAFDATPEDEDPRDSLDPELHAETLGAIERGDMVHFIARVRVMHKHTGAELGADYLGSCIYESPADLRDHFRVRAMSRKLSEEKGREICIGSHFSDMVRAAVSEARDSLSDLQAIPVRGNA